METVQVDEGDPNLRTNLFRVRHHRLRRGTALKPVEDEFKVLPTEGRLTTRHGRHLSESKTGECEE